MKQIFKVEVDLCRLVISDKSKQQLIMLLSWCIEETLVEGDPHIQQIIFAPDADLVNEANRIFREYTNNTKSPNIRSTSKAFTQPIEFEDQLFTFIYVAESELHALDRGQPHIDNLALTLMEELLHAKHYTQVFNQRGYVHHPKSSNDGCEKELFAIAFHFIDEYKVGRWKADLIDAELSYGMDLPQSIEQGMLELAGVINLASRGSMDVSEAWAKTFDTLNNYILVPLVREAGRRTKISDRLSPAGDPNDSKMFQQYIKESWISILDLLERSFTSDSNNGSYERNLSKVLKGFLHNIGIYLTPLDNGGCWIEFKDIWSRQINNN